MGLSGPSKHTRAFSASVLLTVGHVLVVGTPGGGSVLNIVGTFNSIPGLSPLDASVTLLDWDDHKCL